jgi:tRNA nucleotidyltransferase (CCA-adding enzyme)
MPGRRQNGIRMGPEREIDRDGLGGRIDGLPGFEAVRAAATAAGVEAFLVGGAVRDALRGRERAELDVVVVGDHLALARALGEEIHVYDRFGTATVAAGHDRVDIARARAESYPYPGALPEVRPAGIDEDLSRRDFSVNAMAVPLTAPGELIDPHRGLEDLRRGLLRALHERSVSDDPTRALRAARYAARLDLEPEPGTLEQIRGADLSTVSADRVEAERRKLAAEPDPAPGFELLDRWGLIELPPSAKELIDEIVALARRDPWQDEIQDRDGAVLAAADGEIERPRDVAAARPARRSEAVAAARGLSQAELLVARALGADWLDQYVAVDRHRRLAISGQDLVDAGIAPGPAIGRGLDEALRALLDGEVTTRADQLEAALAAARQTAS